jgi:hypothetical protein
LFSCQILSYKLQLVDCGKTFAPISDKKKDAVTFFFCPSRPFQLVYYLAPVIAVSLIQKKNLRKSVASDKNSSEKYNQPHESKYCKKTGHIHDPGNHAGHGMETEDHLAETSFPSDPAIPMFSYLGTHESSQSPSSGRVCTALHDGVPSFRSRNFVWGTSVQVLLHMQLCHPRPS